MFSTMVAFRTGFSSTWSDLVLHTRSLLATSATGETGYGWHISDLRIYDEPRELIDFERPYECNECDAKWATECNTCHEEGKIKRAPQSWCYVEAKE